MKTFWENKNVLVTGDTGFKGSWLTCLLLRLGSNVSGISLIPDANNKLYKQFTVDKNFKSENFYKNYKHFDLDIRESENLKNLIKKINPEIVFHLAAQPLVRESYKNPILTWEVNLMGTINLLNSVRNLSNCSVVVITTDKVYENFSWPYSYRENDLLGGTDPYSSSKAAVELAVKSWRESFYNENIKVSTARAGNVIGGGDWASDRIVPDIINALINKKTLTLRYPEAVRPWQHVLDPLCGYLKLAKKQISSQKSFEYNFGPDSYGNISVKELVAKIVNAWGTKLEIQKIESELSEKNYLTLAIDKARSELNWNPHWGIDKSISKTVKWYKNVYKDKSPYLCMLEDINNFIFDI
tara:strand:- start:478 stop:1542 length:1065 start_codon:yes stop_codon:yes gene_type:complete